MAWTESDRVQMRHFLGYSATFTQVDPRLESAITSTQSIVDGGQRPDSSTETAMRGVIADLQSIEAKLRTLWPLMHGLAVDETRADPVRGAMMLRSEGWRLACSLARFLDTRPIANVFSSAVRPSPDGYNPIEKPLKW